MKLIGSFYDFKLLLIEFLKRINFFSTIPKFLECLVDKIHVLLMEQRSKVEQSLFGIPRKWNFNTFGMYSNNPIILFLFIHDSCSTVAWTRIYLIVNHALVNIEVRNVWSNNLMNSAIHQGLTCAIFHLTFILYRVATNLELCRSPKIMLFSPDFFYLYILLIRLRIFYIDNCNIVFLT